MRLFHPAHSWRGSIDFGELKWAALPKHEAPSSLARSLGRDDGSNEGVTPAVGSGYNGQGMLPDAPSESQFALASVLAALPGVPAPLSGSVALAGASQSVR